MKVSNAEHICVPWRIHELLPDFRLEDVWELPVTGEADDFARLVDLMAAFDPERSSSVAARGLFALRWKLGALLGWDRPNEGVGRRVSTLRSRLPDDLRAGPTVPASDALPFTTLYVTDDEWAAETANRTVHGVLHLGWVPDDDGTYHAQMAIYVKPNGLFGAIYMAAIKPFRYLIVYPQILREIGSAWQTETRSPVAQGAPA